MKHHKLIAKAIGGLTFAALFTFLLFSMAFVSIFDEPDQALDRERHCEQVRTGLTPDYRGDYEKECGGDL